MNVNENPLLPLPTANSSTKILETLQNKHGKRYQDIAVMENRYQSSFGPRMMGDCCWTKGNRNKKGGNHNLKAFLNILRTPVKIGSHIDGLQDECTSADGYVKRLNLI